ncbi:MAG: fatty acid desaturase family protein [Planctomycetaceae bacterium]
MNTATTERLKTPRGGRFWLRFLLFPVGSFAGGAILASGLLAGLPAMQACCAFIVGCCGFCVAGSFHEAVHQTLFASPRANVLYGRAVGILVLIPYTAFRETHRTHHAYLNSRQDFELWPYSDPTTSRAFRRGFMLSEFLLGWLASPLIFSRILWANPRGLDRETRTILIREYLVMAAFWIIVVSGGIWLVQTQRLSGRLILMAYLIPSMIAPAINSLRKFIEHLGLESEDPMHGTRSVLGPGRLTRLASYFNFDLAIHGPHHRYPRASHEQLPELLRQLERRGNSEQSPPVFSSFSRALLDLLPTLWQAPGVGETVLRDRGINRDPAPPATSPLDSRTNPANDWDHRSNAA